MLKYNQKKIVLLNTNFLYFQAFRCAGLSVQQQSNANVTPEQLHANLEILRNMANDLIEQYFLPTVRKFFLIVYIKKDK
jgi:hypothetical protein